MLGIELFIEEMGKYDGHKYCVMVNRSSAAARLALDHKARQ